MDDFTIDWDNQQVTCPMGAKKLGLEPGDRQPRHAGALHHLKCSLTLPCCIT